MTQPLRQREWVIWKSRKYAIAQKGTRSKRRSQRGARSARAVQGAQKKRPSQGDNSDPYTRSQVGGEMPMKPGAMSRTNPGFSRWPYGVDQGAPNALQWNCASTRAQGIAPAKRRRAPRGGARTRLNASRACRRRRGAMPLFAGAIPWALVLAQFNWGAFGAPSGIAPAPGPRESLRRKGAGRR